MTPEEELHKGFETTRFAQEVFAGMGFIGSEKDAHYVAAILRELAAVLDPCHEGDSRAKKYVKLLREYGRFTLYENEQRKPPKAMDVLDRHVAKKALGYGAILGVLTDFIDKQGLGLSLDCHMTEVSFLAELKKDEEDT